MASSAFVPLTVVFEHDEEPLSWTLDQVGSYPIGRSEQAFCLIPDRRVSRVHGNISFNGHHWVFEDASSAGTYLIDGESLSAAVTPLTDGPITILSDTRLRLGDPLDGPVIRLSPRAIDAGEEPAPRGGRTAGHPVVNPQPVRVRNIKTANRLPGSHLVIRDAGYRLKGQHGKEGKALLRGIDLDLAPGTLTAVVGPSGAGKSTFVKLLIGQLEPTSGSVQYGGHDVAAEQRIVRQHIGYVPQDDIVHRELTVERALDYAAQMRLGPTLPAQQVSERVKEVVDLLELTEHTQTQVDRLSGGQRKRVSVAMELLTEPQVLVLDEPTSGLDPALDESVMVMLRKIADTGRIVVVVTHSPASLQICDSVLVLAPGGMPAFFGTADATLRAYQAASWSTVFHKVASDPEGAHQIYLNNCEPLAAVETADPSVLPSREIPSTARQLRILVRRLAELILRNTGFAVTLVIAPLIMALLTFIVPGSAGLGMPGTENLQEANTLLVVMVTSAALMGMAISYKTIIDELPILTRERAAGMSPNAYLGSKLIVFSVICAIQVTLFLALFALRHPLGENTVILGLSFVELWVALFATAFASCCLSLLGSAIAKSTDQVMQTLIMMMLAQLVLCGGLIKIADNAPVNAFSMLIPSRWGFAAAASSIDLQSLDPAHVSWPDAMWTNNPAHFLAAVGVLIALAALCVLATRFTLRDRTRR